MKNRNNNVDEKINETAFLGRLVKKISTLYLLWKWYSEIKYKIVAYYIYIYIFVINIKPLVVK